MHFRDFHPSKNIHFPLFILYPFLKKYFFVKFQIKYKQLNLYIINISLYYIYHHIII